jgi:OmpA-OmpF porin, OOP family
MRHSNRSIHGQLKYLLISMPFLFASPLALAQDSGFYAGMSFGESSGHISRADIGETLEANGRAISLVNKTDRDNAWKILAGYDFNRLFATELSYFDLGSYDFGSTLVPTQNLNGRAGMTGYGLDLVATVPMSDNLSALLRAGLTRTSVKQTFFSSSATATGFANQTDSDTRVKAGIGLEYAVTDAFSVRGELEYYRLPANQITRSRANLASVGVVYRFGRTPAPAPVAPTPVAAPAPAPAPTPPPAPQPVSVTLAASALFDFDQAVIKPAGRQELDTLIRQINGLNYETVIVIGHTDRIGTRDYNLGLSERRANAVRDYLVQAGIPANRITARGVANDQPVTPPTGCRGLGSNAATIACLEPDRRVVIEIHGTRTP